MNQKQIGTVILVVGILLAVFVFFVKAREDMALKLIVDQRGSCYLEDGTCLHDQSSLFFVFGVVLTVAMIVLGIYLLFFDKTQQILAKHQIEVSSALKEAKIQEKSKDEFTAFLAGFSDDEQKVLKAIHDQEGILQSTLRYRTGISKASLSLMLKSFEDRDIISRKISGKSNQVFLRKRF